MGYEGLTRWADGTSPDVRFAEAVALGIAAEVERASLAAIVEDARGLDPTLWLGVNVSPSLVLAGALPEVLEPTDRPIVVEITEYGPIEDHERLAAALAQVPGLRFAVDDAGAGYASLRTVMQHRPHVVKLDIIWTRHLDADPARQALVGGLAGFTRQLGCMLVAEGVETKAERDALRALGVPLGQGYLMGRPKPAASLSVG